MTSKLGLFLLCGILLLSIPGTGYATAKSSKTVKKAPVKVITLEGFLVKVKDARTVALDNGKHIYFLKRKQTYLKNQMAFRQPANKRVQVKITAADVFFRAPSPTKKRTAQAL